MITINDLVLKYGDKVVLNNINKSFESSKVHGIVGLNGAGKTSLFNVIAKVIKVESGEIFYNNEEKITHNVFAGKGQSQGAENQREPGKGRFSA